MVCFPEAKDAVFLFLPNWPFSDFFEGVGGKKNVFLSQRGQQEKPAPTQTRQASPPAARTSPSASHQQQSATPRALPEPERKDAISEPDRTYLPRAVVEYATRDEGMPLLHTPSLLPLPSPSSQQNSFSFSFPAPPLPTPLQAPLNPHYFPPEHLAFTPTSPPPFHRPRPPLCRPHRPHHYSRSCPSPEANHHHHHHHHHHHNGPRTRPCRPPYKHW